MALERQQEIRDIISEGMDKTLTELGLSHWRVRVEYTHFPINDGFQAHGTCMADFSRERALIQFDLAAMLDLDDDEVMAVVRHECMHIIHAPFHLMRAAMRSFLTEEQFAVLDEAQANADELTVRNLERMYHSLTHPNGG